MFLHSKNGFLVKVKSLAVIFKIETKIKKMFFCAMKVCLHVCFKIDSFLQLNFGFKNKVNIPLVEFKTRYIVQLLRKNLMQFTVSHYISRIYTKLKLIR